MTIADMFWLFVLVFAGFFVVLYLIYVVAVFLTIPHPLPQNEPDLTKEQTL